MVFGGIEKSTEGVEKTVWQEDPDDAYSPKVVIFKDNGIGIQVGGKMIVHTPQTWHGLHNMAIQDEEGATQTVNIKVDISEECIQMLEALTKKLKELKSSGGHDVDEFYPDNDRDVLRYYRKYTSNEP